MHIRILSFSIALCLLFLLGCAQTELQAVHKRLTAAESYEAADKYRKDALRGLLFGGKFQEAADTAHKNRWSVEDALNEIIAEKKKPGAQPAELLSLYRFHTENEPFGEGFYFGYPYFEYRAGLIETEFALLREKNPDKYAMCQQIVSLANAGDFDNALALIRQLPPDHSDAGMCALSMARAVIGVIPISEHDLSIAEPLLVELVKRFPDVPIHAPAAKEIFNKKMSHSSTPIDIEQAGVLEKMIDAGLKGMSLHYVRGYLASKIGHSGDTLYRAIDAYKKIAAEDPREYWRRLAAFSIPRILESGTSLYPVNEKPVPWETAKAAYLKAISDYPESTEADEATARLINEIQRHESAVAARAYFEKLKNEFAGRQLPGGVILSAGCVYSEDNALDAAADLFKELVSRGKDDPYYMVSLYDLARTYLTKGDNAAFVETATSLAEAEDPGVISTVMVMSTYRQVGQAMLAFHYMEIKDWEKAIEWLYKWTPENGCGNCLDAELTEREEKILEALGRLGFDNDSVYIELCRHTFPYNPEKIAPVLRHARERGELDSVLAQISELPDHARPIKIVAEYFVKSLKYGAENDSAALYKEIEGLGKTGVYCDMERYGISLGLTSCVREFFTADFIKTGEKARTVIVEKLDSYVPSENATYEMVELAPGMMTPEIAAALFGAYGKFADAYDAGLLPDDSYYTRKKPVDIFMDAWKESPFQITAPVLLEKAFSKNNSDRKHALAILVQLSECGGVQPDNSANVYLYTPPEGPILDFVRAIKAKDGSEDDLADLIFICEFINHPQVIESLDNLFGLDTLSGCTLTQASDALARQDPEEIFKWVNRRWGGGLALEEPLQYFAYRLPPAKWSGFIMRLLERSEKEHRLAVLILAQWKNDYQYSRLRGYELKTDLLKKILADNHGVLETALREWPYDDAKEWEKITGLFEWMPEDAQKILWKNILDKSQKEELKNAANEALENLPEEGAKEDE